MRKIVWLFWCVAALMPGALRAEVRDPQAHFFQQTLGDLRDELKTARAEGKKGVLLMFELDDCPFCHRMKQTVLNQSGVQDYFRRHFVIFTIDASGGKPLTDFAGKDTSEKAFALEQRVRATPVFVFYDLDGQPLTRFTGASKDPAEFLLLGRYVVDGAYKTQPFARYKQAAQ